MGIEAELDAALARAHRDALIASIRANPEMTLPQLATLGRMNGLGSVTIGEILHGRSAGTPKVDARGVDTRRRSRPSTVNTRTPEGRANYDQAVLGTLAVHSPMRAEQIQALVGGAPEQLRASLRRLIAARLVRRRGRTRATTYSAN